MRFIFANLMVLCVLFSCSKKSKTELEISKINIDYSIKRYEVAFYNATKKTLPKVKEQFPYLFPKNFTDSLALLKINNKSEQELFIESQKVYKNFTSQEKQLSTLFKSIKYYNPKFKAPDVVTILTNIDYDSKVIYTDSLLLISLDVYLGKEHSFYSDFPKYIKENNTKEHLIVDVAKAIIKKQIPPSTHRNFISKMIYEGKKMYLLDRYLPFVKDVHKIGFSQNKYDWATSNEEQVWMYFIEKNLLFSTDTKLNKRFLENGPFSKFYTEQDKRSPGRIGVWMGWQIVRSFMEHNNVSLQEFLNLKEEEIFKKSKYKPKK